MRHEIIDELARFLEVPTYQVTAWDRDLIEYFAHNEGEFLRFKQASHHERHIIWCKGYRYTRRMRAAARY